MAEKRICQLPTIRVGESLLNALTRLAAIEDRTFSEYVRRVLEHHVYGHARSVYDDGSPVTDFGALHCGADDLGGRR